MIVPNPYPIISGSSLKQDIKFVVNSGIVDAMAIKHPHYVCVNFSLLQI